MVDLWACTLCFYYCFLFLYFSTHLFNVLPLSSFVPSIYFTVCLVFHLQVKKHQLKLCLNPESWVYLLLLREADRDLNRQKQQKLELRSTPYLCLCVPPTSALSPMSDNTKRRVEHSVSWDLAG